MSGLSMTLKASVPRLFKSTGNRAAIRALATTMGPARLAAPSASRLLSTTPARQLVCNYCMIEGHLEYNCPNRSQPPPRRSWNQPAPCYRCGETGHKSRECPQPPRCHRCNKEGHKASDCTAPKTCYNCGSQGHLRSDCPQPSN